jgi:hypothetical protein
MHLFMPFSHISWSRKENVLNANTPSSSNLPSLFFLLYLSNKIDKKALPDFCLLMH